MAGRTISGLPIGQMVGSVWYRVSWWDHDPPEGEDNWVPFTEVYKPMQLRGPIRQLLTRGFDWDMSILVERIEQTQPKKKKRTKKQIETPLFEGLSDA